MTPATRRAPAFSAFAWSGRPDGSSLGPAGIAWLALQADLTGLLAARQVTERDYASLPDLFAPFAVMPEPAAYDPLIARFAEVLPAMAWAAVMSGAAVASTLPPVPVPELVLQGSTVAEVVAETRAAITRLAQAILDQERKIADAKARHHALARAARWRLVAPRPRLADATRATVLVDLGVAG